MSCGESCSVNMSTVAAGAIRVICLAASSPFMMGICRSRINDVGMQLLDSFNGNLAIFRLTAHPSVRILLDVEPNHAADGSAVIDNENGVPGVRIRGMRERLR